MNIKTLVVIAGVVLVALLTSHARGQCTRWLPGVGSSTMDGRVEAMVAWDPDGNGPEQEWLVIGGTFTQIGPTAIARLAAFDGTQWRSLGALNGDVSALAVYRGELIVAGTFSAVAGISAPGRLARFNGTTWESISTSLIQGTSNSGTISTLLEFQGRLIAAGDFSQISGVTAVNVAAFDDSWNPMGNGVSTGVVDMVVFENQVFSIARNLVGAQRWSGSSWLPTTSGFPTSTSAGIPTAIAVYDGSLYLAGQSFSFTGTSVTSQFARLNGNAWAPVPTASGNTSFFPLFMRQFGSRLIVGGTMAVAGQVIANNIAAWTEAGFESLQGGLLATSSFNSAPVTCAVEWRGQMVVGGDFDRSFSTATVSNVALFDGFDWRSPAPSVDDSVYFSVAFRDSIVFGGEFSVAGGQAAFRVAAWNGQTWQPLGNGLANTAGAAIARCATVFQNDLIVGGSFSIAGNIVAGNIARWDGQQWHAMGSGFDSTVESLIVFNGELYATGSFSRSGVNSFGGRVARWDNGTWKTVGFSGGPGGTTTGLGRVLVEFEGRLHLFGPEFWGFFNGNNWVPLVPIGSLAPVNAAVVHNRQLYIGGNFTTINNITGFRGIAVRQGTDFVPVSGGFLVNSTSSASGTVRALASVGGRLLAGGEFGIAGGLPASNIAALDGGTWSALGSGTTSTVRSIQTVDSELIIGGDFTAAGSTFAANWARYTTSGVPVVITNSSNRTLELGSSLTLSAVALPGYDAQGAVQYSWRRDGVPLVDSGSGASASIDGSATATLRITNLGSADSGEYTCHITNACGTRIHQAGTVDVVFICRADLDASGALESSDIFVFLNAWFTGSIQGDFDRDGDRDPADIFAFLNAYFAGC